MSPVKFQGCGLIPPAFVSSHRLVCAAGEAREDLCLLPLHLRKSLLERAIQLIKEHAPDYDEHMLAGKAAHVLTNLCGHDPELDKIVLKSKVCARH